MRVILPWHELYDLVQLLANDISISILNIRVMTRAAHLLHSEMILRRISRADDDDEGDDDDDDDGGDGDDPRSTPASQQDDP